MQKFAGTFIHVLALILNAMLAFLCIIGLIHHITVAVIGGVFRINQPNDITFLYAGVFIICFLLIATMHTFLEFMETIGKTLRGKTHQYLPKQDTENFTMNALAVFLLNGVRTTCFSTFLTIVIICFVSLMGIFIRTPSWDDLRSICISSGLLILLIFTERRSTVLRGKVLVKTLLL